MGIEGGSNSEVQNQEINQANNEQNEINQAEHQRSGEELDGNSTIDNEGERKQIEGKDDATESAEDESSQLDKEDNIEDDPNTEQPPESDNVAPEQQLDNQDTIESDPSGADEMGEDNNETVDSLDNDNEIEDSEDLDDNQDSTEGDIQDSLDTEDSIDSDETDDSVEEDDNNEQDPLDSEDSIEDDGEESENPEGEEDTENPKDTEESENPKEEEDTENPDDGEESETPEVEEDTENLEEGEESENPEDGEESELPEGEEKTENPEDNEETESPEDNEKTENPEGEDTDNPEGEEESEPHEGEETENPDDNEESERPEGKEDTENPDGATTDNPEANSDMNTLYSIADGGSGSDGGGLNAPDSPNGPDGSDGPDNPENIKGYKDIGEFNDELNKLYSDSQLSNQEKVEAAKGCVDKLNNSDLSPQEKKQSVDAPSDARALKNPENSDWTERTDDNPWPPLNIDFPDKMGLDYDKEITPLGRGEDATGLPETAYRYGGEGGYNYTCEAADGHVPSLDERALPKEYVPEKDREVHFDNDRYCNTIDAIRDYESDPAASLESLNNMIDDINAERGTYIDHLDVDELEALSDKYKQLQDTEFADVRDELGIDDKDFTAYGVHGHAKPMEDTNGDTICEGGADQFNTALPEYMLKRIGVEY